jgi:hypothetical protein
VGSNFSLFPNTLDVAASRSMTAPDQADVSLKARDIAGVSNVADRHACCFGSLAELRLDSWIQMDFGGTLREMKAALIPPTRCY